MDPPVIFDAIRMPSGKRNRPFGNTSAQSLLAATLTDRLEQAVLDPAIIEGGIAICVTTFDEQRSCHGRFNSMGQSRGGGLFGTQWSGLGRAEQKGTTIAEGV